jgi:hypothetical protein
MWPVKGSSVSRSTSTRSLINSDRYTTPRLPSRASQPPGLGFNHLNPKVWYLAEVHLFRCWTHQGRDGSTIISLFFVKIPIHSEASSFVLKQNILFSKARLSIKNPFYKRVSRKGNQFSRKEMHQLFSTQLLSPNASNKVIKILKQQGGGKCTRACLDNTKLVFVIWRPLGDQLLFQYLLRLSVFRFIHQYHLVKKPSFTTSCGRLSSGSPHHVVN